jgi:hypothetical protein
VLRNCKSIVFFRLVVMVWIVIVGHNDTSEKMPFGAPIFATGAYLNDYFYLAGIRGPMAALLLNTSVVQFSVASTSTGTFGFPGSTPSVSASGTTNGIGWAMNNASYCTAQAKACGPAILYAFNATNVANELRDSSMFGADAAGYAVKFEVPTVANGKVYIGTRGNNIGGADSSTTVPGELDVYGLKATENLQRKKIAASSGSGHDAANNAVQVV